MSKTSVKVPAEIYSRVVGYFRPVNQWNNGKREEFSERKTYVVNPAAVRSCCNEYQGNI